MRGECASGGKGEEWMKKLIFNGIGCEDIILHLAKILLLTGTESIIYDDDLNYSYAEVPVVRSLDLPDVDGMLFVNGTGGNLRGDVNILVTDLQPANARRFEKRKYTFGNGDYDLVIIRDMTGNDKNGEHIINLLKSRAKWVGVRENERDKSIRYCLQEGIRYRLRDLSRGMKKGLIEITEVLTGLSEKECKKAFGKEKRWGGSLNSGRDRKMPM